MILHKRKQPTRRPRVSIILLDWSVREHFQALDWLAVQDVSRDDYELIWIELHDRVAPEALAGADIVATLGQKGLYHKHKAYNQGVLLASGEIVTVCDSDAVFPPDFVRSIIEYFKLDTESPWAGVLMHHEWRTKSQYPGTLPNFNSVHDYEWLDLWPNAGACMSVRLDDLIRFGGFDEAGDYRGYLCGPYELGWRMVNGGFPEVWHDEEVALWHFAHPDPPASFGREFSLKRWLEIRKPHVDHHALAAVEAFSAGRLLPKRENPEIHSRRMAGRRIGSDFEKRYADLCGPEGFTFRQLARLHLVLLIEPFLKLGRAWLYKFLGPQRYESLKKRWHAFARPD